MRNWWKVLPLPTSKNYFTGYNTELQLVEQARRWGSITGNAGASLRVAWKTLKLLMMLLLKANRRWSSGKGTMWWCIWAGKPKENTGWRLRYLFRQNMLVKEIAGSNLFWPGFGINTLELVHPVIWIFPHYRQACLWLPLNFKTKQSAENFWSNKSKLVAHPKPGHFSDEEMVFRFFYLDDMLCFAPKYLSINRIRKTSYTL